METVLEKQDWDTLSKNLNDDGYVILKDFYPKKFIERIRLDAQNIFRIQFRHFGYEDTFDVKDNMIRLFNEHEEVFKNCGKLIQTGLLSLYELCSSFEIETILKQAGLMAPVMCTRPVLYFNHPKLAKDKTYYKTPKHQDWPSMQSSDNSVVIWIPLVDVTKENGGVIFYPGSHKNKLIDFTTNNGFAEVNFSGPSIQPELKVGDAVIFSTYLVHESGDILNDSIRWSCHLRYTDCLASDFIEAGFPNPYQYIPITKQK